MHQCSVVCEAQRLHMRLYPATGMHAWIALSCMHRRRGSTPTRCHTARQQLLCSWSDTPQGRTTVQAVHTQCTDEVTHLEEVVHHARSPAAVPAIPEKLQRYDQPATCVCPHSAHHRTTRGEWYRQPEASAMRCAAQTALVLSCLLSLLPERTHSALCTALHCVVQVCDDLQESTQHPSFVSRCFCRGLLTHILVMHGSGGLGPGSIQQR